MELNVSIASTGLKKFDLCYCSLLYDEAHITELRVLGLSIETTGADRFDGFNVPKFVLVTTPDITNETRVILKKERWIVLSVNTIINKKSPSGWRFVFTKLQVFSLHRYGCAKVAYIDADTMLIQNPTPIFVTCPGFCATMKHSDRFNASVLVLTPGENILKNMTDSVKTVIRYDGGDQGMLNALYPHMANAPSIGGSPCNSNFDTQGQARLPPGFNADIGGFITTGRWAHAGSSDGKDSLYIVHFTVGTFKSHMSWLWWWSPTFQAYGWHEYAVTLDPPPALGVSLLVQGFVAVMLLSAVKWVQIKWTKSIDSNQNLLQCYVLTVVSIAPSLILIVIVYLTPIRELPVDLKRQSGGRVLP